MTKKRKKTRFLNFKFDFVGRIGRILAKNLSEGPTNAKVLPKKFLDEKKQKLKF